MEEIVIIGDSIASFPPASGYGFTHCLVSAVMAVDYFLKNDPEGYKKTCKKMLTPRLRWAIWLHHLMLQPRIASWFFRFPRIAKTLLHKVQQ